MEYYLIIGAALFALLGAIVITRYPTFFQLDDNHPLLGIRRFTPGQVGVCLLAALFVVITFTALTYQG